MHLALLLISLAVGYKVYMDGNSQTKKKAKQLGRAIGVFIMILSVAATLCATASLIKKGGQYGYCPLQQKALSR